MWDREWPAEAEAKGMEELTSAAARREASADLPGKDADPQRSKGQSGKSHAVRSRFILAGVLSAVCFGLSLNALILSTDLAEHSRGFQRVQEAELAMTPLMGLFRLCIRAPFLEELMFRLLLCYGGAYVLGRLMPRKRACGIALVLSSLVFALLHGNIVQGLYAFLMGLLLGGFLLASRILYISFLMHAAANLTVYGLGLTGYSRFLYNPFCAALFFALGLLALKLLLPREMLRVRKPDAARENAAKDGYHAPPGRTRQE